MSAKEIALANYLNTDISNIEAKGNKTWVFSNGDKREKLFVIHHTELVESIKDALIRRPINLLTPEELRQSYNLSESHYKALMGYSREDIMNSNKYLFRYSKFDTSIVKDADTQSQDICNDEHPDKKALITIYSEIKHIDIKDVGKSGSYWIFRIY